jgi:glycosyltransferase 2 family protein
LHGRHSSGWLRLSVTTPPPATDPFADGGPLPSVATRIWRATLGLFAGLAVAAVAGWALGVKPGAVLRYIEGVPPWAVAGCVASSFIVLALQSLRWHQVMRPLLGLTYGQAYRAQVVGMMFNSVLPARGGDLLRVQYLGRRTGKSRATILATEVIDRWLDWWGWFPVLAVMVIFSHVPTWLFTALGIFGALLGSWALLMFWLGRRGYVPKPGSRFGEAYRSFQIGIKAFKSKRTFLIALAVAPLPWLWEAAVITLAGRAFGMPLTLAMGFSVLIGFNIAMVVPSPGAIGTVEAGGTAALIFFGFDHSKALAFMFVYHFSQLLPGIATGAAILVAEREKLFGKKTPVQAESEPSAQLESAPDAQPTAGDAPS